MIRWVSLFCSVVFFSSWAIAQDTAAGDAQARALAAQAMAALAGSTAVTDVTLTGTVTRTAGSDVQTGTATLQATKPGGSLVKLGLTLGERTEVRATQNGLPQGQWSGPDGAAHSMAGHNVLQEDAAWFFPALSALAHYADPNYTFSYVGEEEREGVQVQRVRVSRPWSLTAKDLGKVPLTLAKLPHPSFDFYLDPGSHLPVAVAFKVHPDNNMLVDIPAEVRFSDYRAVNGVQTPFHIQRWLNGSLLLDLSVTEAAINSGISEPALAKEGL